MTSRVGSAARPKVALLPWGTPIERFLDPLGRSIDDFCERLTGGWLFGYAVALTQAGYSPSIVVSSQSARSVEHRLHAPTGTPVIVLASPPPGRSHRPGIRRDLDAYRRALPHGLLGVLSQHQAVVVQEYEEPRADLLVCWGSARRVPVLATFQGGIPPWERAPIQRLVRGPLLRRSAGLMAGSAKECERLVKERHVDPGRVHRVANPVDVMTWAPRDRVEARRRLGVPHGALVVAWHGRVDIRRKGIDVLIEAWQQVCSTLDDRVLRLLLVGSGPDDAELRALLSQTAGSHHVDWLAAYAGPDEVRERLAACDLWVSASRHEGFAVAPLEAMASGRPVILTDVPGAAELLGDADGCRPVRPDDARALANAIVIALTSREWLDSSGKRLRQRAELLFSEAAVGRQLRTALCAAGCPPAC